MRPAIIIFILYVMLPGCKSVKQQSEHKDQESVFIKSGYADITIKCTDHNEKRTATDFLRIYSENIVTGEYTNHSVFPDSAGDYHAYLHINSPRVISLQGNITTSVAAYVAQDRTLIISTTPEASSMTFDGDLATINKELYDAPRFTFPDEFRTMADEYSLPDAVQVLADFNESHRRWAGSVNKYISSNHCHPQTANILKAVVPYRKAEWLLANEENLDLKSATDFMPLSEALQLKLSDLTMQNSGQLPRLIAYSRLMKWLGRDDDHKPFGSYAGWAYNYMHRFRLLTDFLNIPAKDTLPDMIQLAISRTLCTGDILKNAGNYNSAVAVIDTIAGEYLTIPEIVNEVRRFNDLLYKRPVAIPDNKAGEILRRMTDPYKGRFVVIDFWGALCPPCRKEIEQTAQFRRKHSDSGNLAVIFLTSEHFSQEEQFKSYVADHLSDDIVYRLANDEFDCIYSMFNCNFLPHHVLIDREGNIADTDFNISRLQSILQEKQ